MQLNVPDTHNPFTIRSKRNKMASVDAKCWSVSLDVRGKRDRKKEISKIAGKVCKMERCVMFLSLSEVFKCIFTFTMLISNRAIKTSSWNITCRLASVFLCSNSTVFLME